MKNRIDQQLDKLTREVISEDGLKKPSKEFKSNVMFAIEQLPLETGKAYEPIISITAWIFICIGIIGSSLFVFLFKFESSGYIGEFFETINASKSIEWTLPGMSWSSPILYAVIILGCLTAIQFSWLKAQYQNNLGV